MSTSVSETAKVAAYDKPYPTPPTSDEDDRYEHEPQYVQWNYDPASGVYTPLPKINLKKKLEPGYYNPMFTQQGPRLERIDTRLDGLIGFDSGVTKQIIDEIDSFWDSESKFREVNKVIKVLYKRGILMYGPPGCGKSSMIAMVMSDIVKRGGCGLQFNGSRITSEFIKIIRDIQPTTKIMVVLEDIDDFIDNHGEADILNMLDGVDTALDNVLFLATSNYYEKLSPRLLRPSRFDLKVELTFPQPEMRAKYLESLCTSNGIQKFKNLKKAVSDTDGLSFADLKELFISVCVFNRDYDACLKSLVSTKHVENSHGNTFKKDELVKLINGATKALSKSR